MPVTRDSPSIQGDVPGPDPARAPPSKAVAGGVRLSGAAGGGLPCQARSAMRRAAAPRAACLVYVGAGAILRYSAQLTCTEPHEPEPLWRTSPSRPLLGRADATQTNHAGRTRRRREAGDHRGLRPCLHHLPVLRQVPRAGRRRTLQTKRLVRDPSTSALATVWICDECAARMAQILAVESPGTQWMRGWWQVWSRRGRAPTCPNHRSAVVIHGPPRSMAHADQAVASGPYGASEGTSRLAVARRPGSCWVRTVVGNRLSPAGTSGQRR